MTGSALAAAPAPPALAINIRGGPRYWLQSYLLMIRWEVLSLRLFLPVMAAVQFLIGGGIVVGFGFLFEEISVAQATYLAVGGAVMPLLTLGLVMVPQQVAEHKLMGTYAFLFSLPVPRMAMYFAGLTVFSIIALPPAAAALGVAAWRYNLSLDISAMAIPAALLVVAVASAVGYAVGHAVPQPRIVNLITQLMIFVVTIFSPINFPTERFPEWLQVLHHVLPMEHAAVVMRSTLAQGLVSGDTWPSWAILAGWAAASMMVTYRVITRRG